MYQEDIAEVRIIVKEEIAAAGVESKKEIADLKKAVKAAEKALADAVKDLEAKIKKPVDAGAKASTKK